MHGKKLFGALVVAAIAAHATFFVVTAPQAIPTSQGHYDARQYRELADSLVAGQGFQLTRGDSRGPDLDRTPVYPLFVALFGSGWDRVPSVLVMQHVLVLLTALMTAWWAKTRIKSDLAAHVAFAVVAFDLTTMTYASYLLTETLFTFFFTISLVAWPLSTDRRPVWRSIAAGTAWGLATLTRPISLYLAPLALLFSGLARQKRPAALRHAAIAVVAGVLVTGVWLVRNHAVSGAVVLSTIEGENLLHYRAALVSLPPGKSVDQWRKELRAATNEGFYDRTDPRQAVALDKAKKRKAFELIVSHPLGIYRLYTVGLPRLYISPNRSYLYTLLGIQQTDANWNLGSLDRSSLVTTLFSREIIYLGSSGLYQLLLTIMAAAGAIVVIKRREAWAIAPLVALVYLTILSSGLETHARFRVPLVPILAVLATRAVAAAIEARHRAKVADLAPR